MNLDFFLSMSLKRLISRLGLTALFLLSASLAVGVVACVPIFAGAVSRRIIQQELGLLKEAVPISPFTVRFYASPTARRPLSLDDVDRYRGWLADLLIRHTGVPAQAAYTEVHSPRYDLIPREGDTRYTEAYVDRVFVVWADRIEEHAQAKAGAPFGTGATPEAMSVWVDQRYLDELGLEIGEQYEIGDAYDRTQPRVRVQIAGVWEPRDPAATFWWYVEPMWHYESMFLTSRQQYEQHILPALPYGAKFISWRYVLDDNKINLARAEYYIEGLEQAKQDASGELPGGALDQSPSYSLTRGQERKTALSVILLGFSVPLLVIIVSFMSAVSSTLARLQAQEVAMWTSRGGKRNQILFVSLLETIIALIVSLPLGLLVGLALAHLLGYSQGFLQFTVRQPLAVSLASVDWRLCAAVLLIALVARLVPIWLNSRRTILAQEREAARPHVILQASRVLLVALLSVVVFYAYQQLAQVGNLGLLSWQPGEQTFDPLLLLAPSLFLLTMPLILTELFAVLVRPLAWFAKFLPSTALYLGALDLGREGKHYRTPIYMLILCLSLGVFYASLAKSADTWLLDRRRYEIGSDLLYSPRGTSIVAGQFSKVDEEPDFYQVASSIPTSEYEQVEGIEAATPVGEYEASVAIPGEFSFVRLLAIERLSFPRVAYYRPDYASESLGALMNRLGARRDGILIPKELADRLLLAEGDRIQLNVLVDRETRHAFEFMVMGAFDYFPTMFPKEASVFVANLEYMQSQTAGVLPHGVWMRTSDDVDGKEVALDVIRHTHVIPERTVALETILAHDRARLERVGIFGVLTVCFVAGTLLSAFILLVHSTASMRGRSLRFAVLQAMGLTRGKVMGTILAEYLGVLVYSIVAGIGLGIAGAYLYVPFFPLSDAAELPIPPFIPLIDRDGALIIAVVMAAVLVLAEGAAIVHLMHTKIFGVLRMGTRE